MTTEYIYELETGQLKEIDAREALEMKTEGTGLVLNMSDFKELQNTATVSLNQYKALERRLQTSEDPRDGDVPTKEYVLQEAWDALTSEVAELDAAWESKKSELTELATQSAATFTVATSGADAQLAEQMSNRYALELAGAKSADRQTEILKQIGNDIKRLSDPQKVALQSHLLKLGAVTMSDVDIDPVYQAARKLSSPEMLQLQAVKQFPTRPTTDYHSLKAAKISGKGIGRL